ncbi:MAG: hypothetical protein ACKOSO_00945 [Actinomycetota bacterium]
MDLRGRDAEGLGEVLGAGAEVDTDRGRIGLKLVAKIEDGVEVSPETVGARYKEQFPNGGGDDGDRGDRGDRGGRDRGRRRRSE